MKPTGPSDSTEPTASSEGESDGIGVKRSSAATVRPFDARVLRRQLIWDSSARWAAAMLMGLGLLTAMLAEEWSAWAAGGLILAMLLLWMQLGAISVRVWHQLQQLTPLLSPEPAYAEARLAGLMKRGPLHRPVRLLLYHRLATLRYRQQRFAETGAICQVLLTHSLGPAERIRGHLLLMLVETHLTQNDPYGAYYGLVELHRMRLTLVETVQRMALQTRYEIAVGYHGLALEGIERKIELAELMPPPQCGAVHAMFAIAATRCHRTALADWLRQRAELICGAEKLEELTQTSRFLDIPDLS